MLSSPTASSTNNTNSEQDLAAQAGAIGLDLLNQIEYYKTQEKNLVQQKTSLLMKLDSLQVALEESNEQNKSLERHLKTCQSKVTKLESDLKEQIVQDYRLKDTHNELLSKKSNLTKELVQEKTLKSQLNVKLDDSRAKILDLERENQALYNDFKAKYEEMKQEFMLSMVEKESILGEKVKQLEESQSTLVLQVDQYKSLLTNLVNGNERILSSSSTFDINTIIQEKEDDDDNNIEMNNTCISSTLSIYNEITNTLLDPNQYIPLSQIQKCIQKYSKIFEMSLQSDTRNLNSNKNQQDDDTFDIEDLTKKSDEMLYSLFPRLEPPTPTDDSKLSELFDLVRRVLQDNVGMRLLLNSFALVYFQKLMSNENKDGTNFSKSSVSRMKEFLESIGKSIFGYKSTQQQ